MNNNNTISVSCVGEEDSLAHPKIYLKIDKDIGYIKCPYCNKHFGDNKD